MTTAMARPVRRASTSDTAAATATAKKPACAEPPTTRASSATP